MRPSKDAKRADVNLSCGREWQFRRSYGRVFRTGEDIASSYAPFGSPLTIDAMLECGFGLSKRVYHRKTARIRNLRFRSTY